MQIPQLVLLILPVLWLVTLFWSIWGRKLPGWFTELLRDGVFLVLTVLLLIEGAIYMANWDPDPLRLRLAHWLADERILDLRALSTTIANPRDVYRMDSDGDGEEEWIAFHRLEENAYFAAVYDAEPCRFLRFHTYPLDAVDEDYLVEDLRNTFHNPWRGPRLSRLGNALDRPALIIHSPNGQTLNLFQWVDEAAGKCEQAAPGARRYETIGSFRGSAGVTLDENEQRVVVLNRNGFERSQLAVEHVYELGEDGTFLRESGVLTEPVISRITFVFDNPGDLRATYYPEKAVLAFYLALFQGERLLGGANWRPQDYLSSARLEAEEQQPGEPYDLNSSTFGLAGERGPLDHARVLGISYAPNEQAEQAQEAREVTVVAVGIDRQGREVPPGRLITWSVIAQPNNDAPPYQSEWKLDEIVRQSDYR